MKTNDKDNMSLCQPLGTRRTLGATKGRRGGQNAPTSALPHSENRRAVRFSGARSLLQSACRDFLSSCTL